MPLSHGLPSPWRRTAAVSGVERRLGVLGGGLKPDRRIEPTTRAPLGIPDHGSAVTPRARQYRRKWPGSAPGRKPAGRCSVTEAGTRDRQLGGTRRAAA